MPAAFVMHMMFVGMFRNHMRGIFRFASRCKVCQHATEQCRCKSGHRAQNRKWEPQQRIRRQNGIHARRRSRNQKAHARALARPFLANRNRCRNHAATANRKRNAKQSRPQHRSKIRFRNFRHINMVRHPHVEYSCKQKTEQQERRHLRKQRNKFMNKSRYEIHD